MNKNIFQIIVLVLGLLGYGLFAPLNAQNRPTDKEVQVQKVFIEANKEKVLGNIENAEYLFGEVVKKDKENHAAYYELARIHITKEELDKAKKKIEVAIDMQPENIWYNTLYVDVLIEKEQYKEAATVFDNLVKIAPEEIGFQFERALVYAKAGKPDVAVKVYNEIEKSMGVNPETSSQKHALYLAMNKPTKAAQELENLVKAFPLETDYLLMLAEHHEKTGDSEKAKATYKKVLALDPNEPIATLAIAENFHAEGQNAEYLHALQSIFSNPELNIDVKIQEIIPYISLVGEAKDEKLEQEAIILTELLTKAHPDEAKAFAIHGDMLNHADKPAEALVQYKKSLALNNSIYTVWEQVLYINSALGQTEDLLKNSEEAMDLFPNQPLSFFFNGIANSQQKKHEDAIDAFQQALFMVGKNMVMKEQILLQLGSSYHYSGNHKKSDESFEKALQLNANNPTTLNNFSYYLAERGVELDKAAEMAEKANELSPDSPNFMDTYGWVLYQQKKYQDAKKWIGKALSLGGDKSPEILENYGDTLFQLNEVDEAVKYWQKAQEQGGDSKDLEQKIANKRIVK